MYVCVVCTEMMCVLYITESHRDYYMSGCTNKYVSITLGFHWPVSFKDQQNK